ncbi:MAG: DUF4349 domain-containing protein [Alphaproteobacteria bacterium]|nr:DUF4349 domain-containing protein [Alphaproteobacteria bacterium]
MRGMRTIAAALSALALAACGAADQNAQSSGGYAAVAIEEPAPAEAPAPPEAAEDRAQSGPSQDAAGETAAGDPGGPAPVAYLAYTHFIGLELPADRIAGVMDAHIAACTSAGLRRCQIIRTSRSGDQTRNVGGQIELRGEPAWLRPFMARLPGDAETADGRVRDENTSSEDLTRAIVDTEARLRAQSALRDRLQRLLESRPGRLSDLLEVERELARVQGDIDSIQSNLAVMRTRVAMSTLTISYTSSPRAVSGDTMQPLNEAFANFFGLTIRGFAAIVTFIGAILPIAIVGGLIAWLLLTIRKRRGGRLLPPMSRDPAPPKDPPQS